MSIGKNLFSIIPYFGQNLIISIINSNLYKVRHSGKYSYYRDYYKEVDNLDSNELNLEIKNKLNNFLYYTTNNSTWYEVYKGKSLSDFPVLEKTEILNNLDKIKTIDEAKGIISLTGGTTGASMKVIYTRENMQERFAILDHFRSKHGYKLGKRTAWFSGKNLITQNDIKKGRCAHYDYKNKIRFYSTFMINSKNFEVYWSDLEKFQPEFIVGFPSSVYEICKIAKSRGLKIKNKVKVFFPTAETVLPEHRNIISEILGCKLVDQYASSEGAPFILECEYGGLHIHPLTGIFEVVNSKNQLAEEGELLVTSFTTYGTPLIRYRIGDSITLADDNEKCLCQSLFPLVKKIQGRATDYLYSPELGKINLGNLSNSTKDVKGIICFQIIQNSKEKLELFIVCTAEFDKQQEAKFLLALRERVGQKIQIDINYVDDIAKEKSGKFRIVKNNLKFEE